MGYSTRYRIKIHPPDEEAQALEWVEENTEWWGPDEPHKWYEHHQDMIRLTSTLAVMVVLDGEGEGPGDIWRKVYVGGELVQGWRASWEAPSVSNAAWRALKRVTEARAKIPPSKPKNPTTNTTESK